MAPSALCQSTPGRGLTTRAARAAVDVDYPGAAMPLGFELRDAWRGPSLVSLARVPLAALFPCFVDRPAAAIAILLAGGLSDALDGFWARRTGQVTATGAMLDPITDKIFVLSVAMTLLATGRLSALELLLLAAREALELPLVAWRALAKRPDAPPHTVVPGKLVTWLQFLTTGAVVLRFHPRVWLGACAVGGVAVGLAYWWRELRQARARAA
jgi:CDP-diacylglycerol--glycerol-3-phosphate 3-phosphatidyltransferase/cardiolipin synthase